MSHWIENNLYVQFIYHSKTVCASEISRFKFIISKLKVHVLVRFRFLWLSRICNMYTARCILTKTHTRWQLWCQNSICHLLLWPTHLEPHLTSHTCKITWNCACHGQNCIKTENSLLCLHIRWSESKPLHEISSGEK